MNLETYSENFRAMDEYVKAYGIPDKQNEESVEAELFT